MIMSDRIVVMFGGRIHQIGSPREIYHRPASREVAGFIGQSNLFAAKVVAREDACIVVETAAGFIRCKGPSSFAVGATGHVMVRPEAIRLVRPNGGFAGRITEQHFLGNVVDYRVTLADGTAITVQATGEEMSWPGDEVGLLLDEGRAWLLP